MHTGATVTDGQGRTFTVGQELGRGLWARTFALRDAQGRDIVAKVALGREDFPADAPLPEGLLEATAACVDEQAAWLKEGRYPFLPKLLDRTVLDGRATLLLPRYANTLERRLQGNAPLGEALDLMLDLAERLAQIHKDGRVHGDLRPSNVLINDQGRVVLADWIGPSTLKWRKRLAELAPADRGSYLPPEAGEAPRPGWDTWALGLALFRAAMSPAGAPDPRRHPKVELPRQGLDKVQLAALKDRALDRLKVERANPRFVSRVAERLAALVSRAISENAEPSPPYRFLDGGALHPRLEELHGLVFPRITDVGKLLHGQDAREGRYDGGTNVNFTISVGVSTEAATHEDVECGIQILDLDAEGDARVPVPDARYTVKSHPSGRLRFEFEFPSFAPGRYRAKIAFMVKDSGAEREIATGDFEVRPPPGYVPPPRDPVSANPSAIPFPSAISPSRPPQGQPQGAAQGVTGTDSASYDEDEEDAHAAAVHALPPRPAPLDPLATPTPSVSSADLSMDPDAHVRDPDFPMPIAPSQPGIPLPVPREFARETGGPDTRTQQAEPATVAAANPAKPAVQAAPPPASPKLAAPKPSLSPPPPGARPGARPDARPGAPQGAPQGAPSGARPGAPQGAPQGAPPGRGKTGGKARRTPPHPDPDGQAHRRPPRAPQRRARPRRHGGVRGLRLVGAEPVGGSARPRRARARQQPLGLAPQPRRPHRRAPRLERRRSTRRQTPRRQRARLH